MATLTPVRPVFAALPDFPPLSDSLVFQLNGLAVVFVALGAIWGVLELMGWLFRLASRAEAIAKAKAEAAAAAEVAAEVQPEVANGIPGEVLAAISATIEVTLEGAQHQITAITPEVPAFDWAREGRRAIFASHKTH
jgi:hypothetical protein